MAAKIDWYYHRNNCLTCSRSLDFIHAQGLEIVEQVDARKNRIAPAAAIKLVRSAAQVWIARGKKVVHLDLKKDQPTDEALTKLIIGPSGNLRAPTIRRGQKLYIGFHPEEFPKLLG